MSGHDPHDDPSMKGLSRYFNGRTVRGRANVALATYSLIAAFFFYKKITKKLRD